MGRIALVYGTLSGLVVIGIIIVGSLAGAESGHGSEALGYLIMIIALTMIFLGVKRYRDLEQGGVIKFGPALALGLMIAAVAGVFYVAGWEAYLAATGHAFIDAYVDGAIEAKRAAGLAGAALEGEIAKLEEMRRQYGNPLYRLPITFMEIFPVGLVIALISAAILRNPKAFPARQRG